MKFIPGLSMAFAVCVLSNGALAQTKEVTLPTGQLVPLRTVMESGELEKATGYKINWRMFGGGSAAKALTDTATFLMRWVERKVVPWKGRM